MKVLTIEVIDFVLEFFSKNYFWIDFSIFARDFVYISMRKRKESCDTIIALYVWINENRHVCFVYAIRAYIISFVCLQEVKWSHLPLNFSSLDDNIFSFNFLTSKFSFLSLFFFSLTVKTKRIQLNAFPIDIQKFLKIQLDG